MVYCSLTDFQKAVYQTVLETEDVSLILQSSEPCTCSSGRKRRNCCYKVSISVWYVSLVAQMIKESPCNAGDLNSLPGLGRSPGTGHGNASSILAWRIPWTEEPDGLQSVGSQSPTQLSDLAHYMISLLSYF